MTEPVKVYALSTCIYCRNTKAWLDQHDVNYECIEVDLIDQQARFSVLKEIKTRSSVVSFPTIVVGDQVIQGYHPEQLKKVLGL